MGTPLWSPLAATLLCVSLVGCATQVASTAEPSSGADASAPTSANGPTKPASVKFGLEPGFALEAVPAVVPLDQPDVSLSVIDLELLEKLKAARTLDRDVTAEPSLKADAWTAVANHATAAHPYADTATKRAATWTEVAQARARRAQSIEKLHAQFLKDRAQLDKLREGADEGTQSNLEASFLAAYAPFEAEITTWTDIPSTAAAPTPTKPAPKDQVSPILDPLGTPAVRAQRFVLKGDFGAHAQSFSVDTSEDVMSAGGGKKPTFDLSGFYAGGHAVVHVADESDLAIGLLAFGRYHVTTSLPDNQFTSGEGDASLSPPDADATGAFAVGGGARLGGNVTERIGMNLGLTAGYVHFLPPETVPGCGPGQAEWDPTLRGFQGDLFVGFEFYPLALLSFGLSGRVGFGHVEGEWCVPGEVLGEDVDDTLQDVSADAFSVGAQGEIGFHF